MSALHGAPHTIGHGQLAALLRRSTRALPAAEYEAYLGLGSLPVSSVTPELLALALRRPGETVEAALYGLTRRGLCVRVALPGTEDVQYRMHDLTWSAARAHEALLPEAVSDATLSFARAATQMPARLDAERATILEVLFWARQGGHGTVLVDLLVAWLGGPYLAARGFPVAHIGLLRDGSDLATQEGRWHEAAVLLGKLADVQHGLLGNGVEAASLYLQAAGAAERAGHVERQATFLGLSAVLRALYRLPDVTSTLEQALGHAHQSGDPVCVARLLEQQGMIRAMAGDFGDAHASFLEARAALAPLVDTQDSPLATRRAYFKVTGSLAQVAQRLGRLTEAATLREAALAQALALDEQVRVANARADLGEVYSRQGRVPEARSQLFQAIDLYRALGASGPEASARTLIEALPPE